nr:hypothetical protein [Tanacetum cinerariifolium]
RETSSGSTTTHADNSLPEYDSFLFEFEPDQGELSSVAMEAILGEPHVYVPNVLPTSWEEISILFIRDPLYLVFDSLLPFLSENEDKVFKPGILSYLLVTHQDKTTFDFVENPMMIDHTRETSSGSTTTHADNSLPEYDSFLFEFEPDQGELSSVAMEAILGEPHVYVPNVLPTSWE